MVLLTALRKPSSLAAYTALCAPTAGDELIWPPLATDQLGLKERKLIKAEAIALMVEYNNLLKRRILVHPKGKVIGFDEAAYEAIAK